MTIDLGPYHLIFSRLGNESSADRACCLFNTCWERALCAVCICAAPASKANEGNSNSFEIEDGRLLGDGSCGRICLRM